VAEPKPLAKRKQLRVAERQARVWGFHLEGMTSAEIVKELRTAGINTTARRVEDDIQERIEQWRRTAREQVETYIARELDRIDKIEREAWAGWRRSQEDAVSVRSGGKDGDVETRIGQAGDARFLDQIQKCIQQRRDLLGMDAPKRTEISGRDGGPIGLARQLTDDELAEIVARGRQLGYIGDGSGGGATAEEEGPR